MMRTDFLASAVLPAAVCAGSLAAALLLSMAPSPEGPVAAVFPPWWDGARSLAAAAPAGAVVRFGALPFIVVVAPERRDLLHRAGAWLILDPRALGGCTPA